MKPACFQAGELVALGRRDQHDAARHRRGRARQRARARRAPSAWSTISVSQCRSAQHARAPPRPARGGRAPQPEPPRDQRRLDRDRAPRSGRLAGEIGRRRPPCRVVRARGSAMVKLNVAPCARRALEPRCVPPMRSTMRREIASPRPVPPNLRVVPPSACSNSSKMRACASGAMPMPVSRTAKRDLARRAPGSTTIATPPCSVNFTALPARLSSTWRSRAASPMTRPGRRVVDEDAISSAFRLRARRQQLDDFLDQRAEIERPRFEIEPAGLDLGEIEDLLDQRQQRLARGLHRLGVGGLLGRERRVEQEVRHAEDAVERRADFVADHREEAALGAVGRFRLVARVGQRALGLDPVGDVAADALDFGRAVASRSRRRARRSSAAAGVAIFWSCTRVPSGRARPRLARAAQAIMRADQRVARRRRARRTHRSRR